MATASSVEVKMSKDEFEMTLIKSDQPLSKMMYHYLCSLAKEWGVNVVNIALLGGKPYPMQGALFQMFDSRREKEKLVVIEFATKAIQRASQQEVRSGFECFIKLFDEGGFKAAYDKLAKDNGLTVETIEKLASLYTRTYRDEGWASPQTVRMPAMQNIEYINHMGQTRAVDRTLRLVVRCPYTAASELPEGTPDGGMSFGGGGSVEIAPAPRPAGAPPLVKPQGQSQAAPALIPFAVPAGQEPPPKEAIAGAIVPTVVPAQVAILASRFTEYVKRRVSGMKPDAVEEKLAKLVKALYQKAPKDLAVSELGELLDMMEKSEIEIASE